ncbi:MAG: DpnI domain-containing protein [Gemmatimonas sp.]
MVTARQQLGSFGEKCVVEDCSCPRCKQAGTFIRLPQNFKCADIICDFCGYLAQVKAATTDDIAAIPSKVLGAAWGPQKARMDAAIYFPLYLVLVANRPLSYAIYFLAADLQEPSIFVPRKPLSVRARRAGWQGFLYDLTRIKQRFVRLR